MEIYSIDKEVGWITIVVPYYDENGQRDDNYVERLYYRKIGKNKYRFSKNEIEVNPGYKNVKKLENTNFFFEQLGDLIEGEENE